MIISARVYAALLPRREQYLTSIWRGKPFLKFYRLQKLKKVHLNTITAIFTASSAFPQKSSFLILRHCMHGKNNNRATQQRIILGCVTISYRQRKAYRNAHRCRMFLIAPRSCRETETAVCCNNDIIITARTMDNKNVSVSVLSGNDSDVR